MVGISAGGIQGILSYYVDIPVWSVFVLTGGDTPAFLQVVGISAGGIQGILSYYVDIPGWFVFVLTGGETPAFLQVVGISVGGIQGILSYYVDIPSTTNNIRWLVEVLTVTSSLT